MTASAPAPTWICPPAQADPERAARIAAAGRRFACGFLTEAPRKQFWHKLLRRYARDVQAYDVTFNHIRARHAESRLWVFDARDVRCRSIFEGNWCALRADSAGLVGAEEMEQEADRRRKEGMGEYLRDGWWDGAEWRRGEGREIQGGEG